jgi:TonB-dependent starch-binding outer membrane protein SusC
MKPTLTSLLLSIMLAGCASGSHVPQRRDFQQEPPARHAAELLRHSPGVRLVGTGGEMKVFIRGSLDEPLVIVDGMSLTPDARGVLRSIDPRDVAAIKVLTDPADLTFYGIRGANGVVVITSKISRGAGR